MSNTARAVMTIGIVLACAASAAAQVEVSASDGWISEPAAGATTTQASCTIRNPTMYDVYVVSATSDASERIEFRESAPPGGEARVVKELTVPAFGALDLTPQGAHMVLVGLKQAPKSGDLVTITLTTDSGVVLKVAAVVRP